MVEMYNNLYACAYTKFSRDSLKCALCGLHPCQYCHNLPYILAEVIHKPIWKCINNGENNMYQLGLQVKKKLILFFQDKIFKQLFTLFLQIHETPYPSFPSLSSKRDHEEMEQGNDEMMEGTDKKIKT